MRDPAFYLSDDRPVAYPSEADHQRMLTSFASWPQRVAAAKEMAAVESRVLDYLVAGMQQRYPNMGKHHADTWPKTRRDVQLVMTYQTKALLLDSTAYLDERVLVWFRTILKSFSFTPKSISDTYTLLREGLRRELSAESFQLLEPILTHTAETMADIPEPATPAV